MAGSGVVFAESGVSLCPGLRLNDQGSTSGQVSLITGYGCTFAQGERPRQERKTAKVEPAPVSSSSLKMAPLSLHDT